jgi:peptidoglycan/xylan/chitin deacetylase (PgdA/CDA1 family)
MEYATSWRQAAPYSHKGPLKSVLRYVALSALSGVPSRFGDRFLRALYCHFVFDDQRRAFEKTIISLKKIGKFIDTDCCLEMLQGKREIDGRYFHLSFDDGFRNVFTNAIPILKKHAVPAIIFVPSSLVEADWESTYRYCMETTKYRSVIEMITWDDLRKTIALGYEVGSHTKTHARFSNISNDPILLRDEIIGSKKDIENQLGIECKYISWPYGNRKDADDVSLAFTKEAGYKACFGAFRGTIRPESCDRYSIPRHHFEPQWPLSHIKYFAKGNMEKT